MAVRVPPWLFVLIAPLIKAQGADRWDGNDWNKISKAVSQVVKLDSTDSPFATEITDALFKCDTAGGSITLGLPPAAQSAGKWGIAVKTSASNSMVVDPDGGETINSVANISTTGLHSWILFWSDATEWWALFAAAPAGGTDELMIFQEGGVQVGSQARKGNFDATAFNLVEDAGNNRVNISANFGSSAGTIGQGNDARFSDARTPLAHVHPLLDLTNSGGASGDIIYWNGTNWIKLPKGADGTVLKLSGGVPAWGTDLTGGSTGQWNVVSKTSGSATPATAAWGDAINWSTGSGDKEVDITTAVGHGGERILIKKTDNGTGILTIDPSGTQTIDDGGAGDPVHLIAFKESIVLFSDGTNLFVESWT